MDSHVAVLQTVTSNGALAAVPCACSLSVLVPWTVEWFYRDFWSAPGMSWRMILRLDKAESAAGWQVAYPQDLRFRHRQAHDLRRTAPALLLSRVSCSLVELSRNGKKVHRLLRQRSYMVSRYYRAPELILGVWSLRLQARSQQMANTMGLTVMHLQDS